MNRRVLLKSTLALPALTIAGRLYSAPATDMRLLIVFLRGAYDATNVVIPVSSSFYFESRPTLAIGADATQPLDRDWGLHPALADSIYPLFRGGQVAFVPFAGTDDASRSHFETQDTIELGQAPSAPRNYDSGFMSRLVGVLSAPRPVAFTSHLPLTFRGTVPVPNVSLISAPGPGMDAHDAALIQAMYGETALAPVVAEGFRVRDEVYRALSVEMQSANRNATSPKGFELAAEKIGILMRDRFNLGFVDVAGWDTHVNQGSTQGYLAARVSELGRALAILPAQLGDEWKNTIVIVISEFGRTFRENGNRGTDHGHGTVYWILGGNIKGGRIAGDQVEVTQATLFQDRDYPVLNEYRAVISGIIQKLYGLGVNQLQTVFPDAPVKSLALL